MTVRHQHEVNQMVIVPRVGCNGCLTNANQAYQYEIHLAYPYIDKLLLWKLKNYVPCPFFFTEAKHKHIQEPMGQSTPYQKSIVSQYQLKELISNRKRVSNSQALSSTIESVIDNRQLLRNQCNRQLSLTQQINNQLLSDYEKTI